MSRAREAAAKGLSATALVALSGLLGLAFGKPWLFPSLGPSALLRVHHADRPSASLYNTLVGHLIGIAAGYAAVLLVGANGSPAVMATDLLTWPRIAASCLAMFLTVFIQLAAEAYHPPAAATTLLITLGAFSLKREEIVALVVGVTVVALAGELVRRGGPVATKGS